MRNISTNISTLGQRTHLKLEELSSLFIVYNTTIFMILTDARFLFYFPLRDNEHTLFRKVFQSTRPLNFFCFAFVRIFASKKPVQMFAYLISEVQCNVYQVCISTVRRAASPDLPQRLDQERSLWKAFSKHRAGKLAALCLLKESCHFFAWLVHMRCHAVTADRSRITTHESRSWKITELIKSKNISFERFFKAQDR